jgi:hypothetical protein
MSLQTTTGAVAHCPITAILNRLTTLSSDHSYSITNPDGQDAVVTISTRLTDSRGNNTSQVENNVVVPAQGSAQEATTLFLNVTYDVTGTVQLTATTEITGAAGDSARSVCSFQLIPADARVSVDVDKY